MNGNRRHHPPARERKLSLEAKLAGYVLAGGALVATTADRAEAGIVYSGIRNLTLDTQFELELNINDTGPLADLTTDFSLKKYQFVDIDYPNVPVYVLRTDLWVYPRNNGTIPNAVAGRRSSSKYYNVFHLLALNRGVGLPGAYAFDNGRYVDDVLLAKRYDSTFQGETDVTVQGPFAGAGDKFLGLRFEIEGSGTHYGWARISVNDEMTAIVHDWAYQDVAGAPIRTGAVPEPSSLGMLALGAVGVLALLRRGKARGAPTAGDVGAEPRAGR